MTVYTKDLDVTNMMLWYQFSLNSLSWKTLLLLLLSQTFFFYQRFFIFGQILKFFCPVENSSRSICSTGFKTQVQTEYLVLPINTTYLTYFWAIAHTRAQWCSKVKLLRKVNNCLAGLYHCNYLQLMCVCKPWLVLDYWIIHSGLECKAHTLQSRDYRRGKKKTY